MDDILEGILKAVVGLLRFVFVVFLLNFIFYYSGKGTLKLLTIGSYPPIKETKSTINIIVFVGTIVSIIVGVVLILISDRIRYVI